MHDQIPADHIEPVRDQAETEVGSAATVSADPAQAQVARRDSKRRDDVRQDGAKCRLGCGRVVHPINIDACQIADDVSGRPSASCRARARRASVASAAVTSLSESGLNALLRRLAAGAER
jgi:hypothetical protein